MAEKVYFEHDDVKVTANQLAAQGTTYPIQQITSVQMHTPAETLRQQQRYRIMSILIAAAAVVVMILFFFSKVLAHLGVDALIFICLGFGYLLMLGVRKLQPEGLYEVKISMASREVTAYSSADQTTVEQVVAAIHQAMQ